MLGRLRIPIFGEKKIGKYGSTKTCAKKISGNLDKKSFDNNGPHSPFLSNDALNKNRDQGSRISSIFKLNAQDRFVRKDS